MDYSKQLAYLQETKSVKIEMKESYHSENLAIQAIHHLRSAQEHMYVLLRVNKKYKCIADEMGFDIESMNKQLEEHQKIILMLKTEISILKCENTIFTNLAKKYI